MYTVHTKKPFHVAREMAENDALFPVDSLAIQDPDRRSPHPYLPRKGHVTWHNLLFSPSSVNS
jgi:hypothetical protein